MCMDSRKAMGGRSRKSLSGLIWLTFRAIGQVLITPFLAFLITYYFEINIDSSGFKVGLRSEMLPWIFTASLVYAMLALVLALTFGGGFRPHSVIERGGWRATLRLTSRHGDASLRRNARRKYATSAHGRLSLLVHERHMAGHRITSTHGGLVLLAIPLQILLATVPLALVLAVPDTIMREDRRLEVALLVYIGCFIAAMKLFPMVARKYIGLATFTRRWLGSMGSVTSFTPFLVLWVLGRVANIVVLGSMGQGISLNFQIEKELFESSFSIRSIPETSFVDLLTALAVMPLAAFTTLAALGAGSDPPDWMYEYNPRPSEESQDPSTQSLVKKGSAVALGATTAVAVAAASSTAAHLSSAVHGLTGLGGSLPLAPSVPAVHQARSVVDAVPIESMNQMESLEDLSRSIDAVQDASGLREGGDADLSQQALEAFRAPSFDEPSITGLRRKK
jgi:hypothetical protein